jgi:hypothetical protein
MNHRMPNRLAPPIPPPCLLPLLLAAACLPTRSASLSIPLSSCDGHTHEAALVTIPLRDLESKMDGLRLQELAIYASGREPVPFRVAPGEDGAERIELVTRVTGDGTTRILAVCPGPRAAALELPATTLPRAQAALAGAHR